MSTVLRAPESGQGVAPALPEDLNARIEVIQALIPLYRTLLHHGFTRASSTRSA